MNKSIQISTNNCFDCSTTENSQSKNKKLQVRGSCHQVSSARSSNSDSCGGSPHADSSRYSISESIADICADLRIAIKYQQPFFCKQDTYSTPNKITVPPLNAQPRRFIHAMRHNPRDFRGFLSSSWTLFRNKKTFYCEN